MYEKVIQYITKNGYVINEGELLLCSDTEISNKSGVSKERIRQIRKKLGLPPNKDEVRARKNQNLFNKRLQQLLEYIKKHPKGLRIQFLKKEFHWKFDTKYVKQLAKTNNIKISFIKNTTDYYHGISKYESNKCRCGICKLSNCIRCRFYKLGKLIGYGAVDELANKYYKKYKKDKDPHKKEFYKFLETTEQVKNCKEMKGQTSKRENQ